MRQDKMDVSLQEEQYSFLKLFLYRLFSQKITVIAILVIILITAVCFLGPVFYRQSPETTDLFQIKDAPSLHHPMGTDDIGRDVLARILEGGQVSILVGIAAALLQLLIGVCTGVLSGYFGGWTDSLLMRITDIVMCFPFFVIAISMAAILGPSTKNVVLIVGCLQWCTMARMVRAEILSLKTREYITAAKALGESQREIIFHHLLPGVLPRCIIVSTTDISIAVLSEAALSFLGLGVQAPQSSWGAMLSSARDISVLAYNWWMWLPAGLLIILVTVSINILGNAMHDAYT